MAAKGFRQIDTQYFEALMYADLTRSGYKILLAVIHFTLGYEQRDTANISLTTFQEMTGLSRAAIRTAIKELIAYGLISVVTPATNRLGVIYRINKDWRLEGKPAIPLEGKPAIPLEILEGSETIPPDVENYTSRGIVATPATMPLNKERKLLKKYSSDEIIPGTNNKSLKFDKGLVTLIFNEMKAHLGFPGKTDKDPIPSYGQEGAAIKTMFNRGYNNDEILACWKKKVAERGGDFVTMQFVNKDIGLKAGHGAARQSSRWMPKRDEYTLPPSYDD